MQKHKLWKQVLQAGAWNSAEFLAWFLDALFDFILPSANVLWSQEISFYDLFTVYLCIFLHEIWKVAFSIRTQEQRALASYTLEFSDKLLISAFCILSVKYSGLLEDFAYREKITFYVNMISVFSEMLLIWVLLSVISQQK